MGHFVKSLLKKYKKTSVEMKAATWYAVGNVVQKMAPWLVMVILTHYLAIEEYGVYTIFMSWLEIFEIIITLRIYSNGYVAGLVRDEENRTTYTATMQSLSVILIVGWLGVYLIFHKALNYATGISTSQSVIMICSFLGTISFGLWSSRQRVDNQYKKMIIAIILYSFVGPVISVLTIFFNFENPIFCVVIIRTVIQLLVAIPFFISNYKGSKIIWNKNFAIDAIKYNLPLMPYYLSMILLNYSDRLMIQKIDGYKHAALYSVSYSTAMIIFVISGALNLSLQSWLFKELKANNATGNKSKLITLGTLVVAFFAVMEIVWASELILFLGGKKYMEAIWVVPPLAISVIIMYIYQQYVNILFYYKKTKFVLLVSVIVAVCNIVLNSIFIPLFGYVAGGYTSLTSYLVVMILYFLLARKECNRHGVNMKVYFNMRIQMIILIMTVIVAIIMLAVYKQIIIRYIVSLLIFVILICTREKWIAILKEGE